MRKKNIVMVTMLAVVAVMSIAYAFFATNLSITSTGSISSAWDVKFIGITNDTPVGSATNLVTPSYTATTATMSADLKLPGDSITYRITLKNNGDIPAIIEDIDATATGSGAIVFSMSGLNIGEKLAGGAEKVLAVKIEYDPNTTSQPSETTKTLTVSIKAVQDTGQSITNQTPNITQGTYLSSAILRDNIAYADNVASPYVTSSTGIDFSKVSSDTNGKGLYYTSTNTENNGTTYYFRGAVTNNFVKIEGIDIDIKLEQETSGTCIYTGGNINYVTSLNDFHLGTYRAPENVTECTSTNVCKVYTESYTAEPLFYAVGLSEDECTAHNQDLYGEYTSDSATFESDQPDIIGDEGFLWRIVRINEDGSVRLISQNVVGESVFFGGYEYYNASVGYMYGDYTSNTYAGIHANINNSAAKTYLDNWYDENLSSYSSIMADGGFCGDRQVYSGTGLGNALTKYAAYNRMNNNIPQFKCTNASNDLYTLTTGNKGNKALTRPIGLITADELKYAGNYINNGTDFVTMTPSHFGDEYDLLSSVYAMRDDGSLIAVSLRDLYQEFNQVIGIRPVINVKGNISVTLNGTGEAGTATNPYIIEIN